jgi:DNA-binding transcriptional ArsR family regulator
MGVLVILDPESVARYASLLADRSRAAICLALMDGCAWTAGELARAAGITAPTANEHLNLLVGAGLLTEERQGRHRYVRLAGADVARLLESMSVAAGQPAPARSLRTVRAAADLAAARTCYDHLAGELGVRLYDAMLARDLVTEADGLALTAAGRSWFADLGGPEALRPSRTRPLLRACVDWTQRRSHLAGALGAVLHNQLVARSWIRHCEGSRAVRVTPAGEVALAGLLGIGPASVPAQREPALQRAPAR